MASSTTRAARSRSTTAATRTHGQHELGTFPGPPRVPAIDRGLIDAFVVKLNPDATRLVYSSYLGGGRSGRSPSTGYDTGSDIVLDEAGNAYVRATPCRSACRRLRILPAEARRRRLRLLRGYRCGDGFLAKISAGGPGVTPAIRLTVNPADVRARRDDRRHLGGNPTPRRRLAAPVRARLRGRRVRRQGDRLVDAECRRRRVAAPATSRPRRSAGTRLRLLSPAPGSEPSQSPIAQKRANPDRRVNPLPPPPESSVTTTTTSTAELDDIENGGSMRNSTLRPRVGHSAAPCVLGSTFPAITNRIHHTEELIDAAAARTGKAERRLVRRATQAVAARRTGTQKAASARRPRLSAQCAAAIRAAIGVVAGSLTRMAMKDQVRRRLTRRANPTFARSSNRARASAVDRNAQPARGHARRYQFGRALVPHLGAPCRRQVRLGLQNRAIRGGAHLSPAHVEPPHPRGAVRRTVAGGGANLAAANREPGVRVSQTAHRCLRRAGPRQRLSSQGGYHHGHANRPERSASPAPGACAGRDAGGALRGVSRHLARMREWYARQAGAASADTE